LAFLIPLCLTSGDHELAAVDVALPAAEVGTVDAFLHRADDFLRIAFAGQHVGVGHPWHRQVRIGFAPTVARGRDAHQPRIQLVLDVALEHAVLDQRGALGRRTFVIDAERTTAPRQGAVVDDGAQWRGHLLADAPAVGGTALAVEVAFQPVADGLVQQHAGPARPQYHRQRAGRRRHRFEVDQRLAQRLAGIAHGAVFTQEVLVAATPATTLATALAPTVLLDDHADVETHQRTDIRGHATIEARHQNVLPDARQAYRHLLDPRVQRACRHVDALEQLDLLGAPQPVQRVVMPIERRERGLLQHLAPPLLSAAGDRTCRLRGLTQRIGSDRIAVGEAGLLAGQGAHAHALLEVEATFLDDAVFQY